MKIAVIFFGLVFHFCNLFVAVGQVERTDKLNAVSMVASKTNITHVQAKAISQLGSNCVAVMPYAFMPNSKAPELVYNNDRQWAGETLEGIKSDIKNLHNQGLEVMIKPHIWIRNEVFTGDVAMTTEADWLKFEQNYKAYILAFAEVAEQQEVSVFCLGTELNEFVIQRSKFWCELIDEVKSVYSGKLTYAEN